MKIYVKRTQNTHSLSYLWQVLGDNGCEIFSGICDSRIQAYGLALQNLITIKILENQSPIVIIIDGLVRIQNMAHVSLFGNLQGCMIQLDSYRMLEFQQWPEAVIAVLDLSQVSCLGS
ncbi:MAG: hypothetical protein ACFBSC_19210 [Microcoleaceae cyanobacterium]